MSNLRNDFKKKLKKRSISSPVTSFQKYLKIRMKKIPKRKMKSKKIAMASIENLCRFEEYMNQLM